MLPFSYRRCLRNLYALVSWAAPEHFSVLHSLNRNEISEQEAQSRRLSEQADSLAARNAELNRLLKELICQIENKVQADLQDRQDEITVMREKSFIQVGD